MKKLLFSLVILALSCLPFATNAVATVINFDDIPGFDKIPDNYGGFYWSWQFFVYNQDSYNTYYNNVTFPSYPNAAYNQWGVTVSMESIDGQLFTPNSAMFTSWVNGGSYYLQSSTTITVEGSRSGVSQGTTSLDPLSIPIFAGW